MGGVRRGDVLGATIAELRNRRHFRELLAKSEEGIASNVPAT
jgi:hypothetical protein